LITRVSELNFNDEQLSCIAENFKKKQKKLFSVVNSEVDAKRVTNELKTNGYQAHYENDNDLFKIYYSSVPKIKMDNNIITDFASIGNNLYQAFNKQSLAGVYDYSYDEGSIWKVQEIDGIKYLVKEIKTEDENDVVRTKTASANFNYDKLLENTIVEELKKQKFIVSQSLIANVKQALIKDISFDREKISKMISKVVVG